MTLLPTQSSCPFDKCGIAARSDLNCPQWNEIFNVLEQAQMTFLTLENHFRSPEYPWPHDSLHSWSRVWEYPYVYHHVRQWRRQIPSETIPRVADVGSGVTFFPFAIARLGYDVICTDIDRICERDMAQAIHVIPHSPGNVAFRVTGPTSLPFTDDELDVLYSISVLEHISNFEPMILEMARVLKPGGLLVLTIDLALNGSNGLNPSSEKKLQSLLTHYFTPVHPHVTVHPADMLLTQNSPCPAYAPSGFELLLFLFKQRIIKPLFLRKPTRLIPLKLAVEGLVTSLR